MSDAITRLNAALEGRYRIESELGEGGMATVYLAEDIKHERKVALKVLKPELAAVVGAERFLAEIKTTANLQHPHILPLFDSGEADSFVFYVMPYVVGETLGDRLDREKQLPVDEAVTIASKVAGALQHAHEQGVIHRDIKPGNMLLQGGEPVVADFGIALAVGAGGGSRLTETGLSVGTPYYMSPEQATGDQEVGPASDIYALAAVLYEILTGDPPYVGSTAQAVLSKILQGAPVSATEIRKSIPTNVDAALRKALEKLPADRFTSAQEFVRALGDEHFRHGEAAPRWAGADSGTWKRMSVGLGTLAAVLGAGWVLFGGGIGGASEIEKSVAVMPCDDQSPAGDQGPLAQGLAEGIITALSRLPDLKVTNITSVVALLAENADIETIAQRLDVATVLECSLQQADDVIRIRSTLVEAASARALWSEVIDGPATNIFAIQDEVARAVTDALQVVFAGGEETPIVAQGTTVSEAHQAYLRGRFLFRQRTEGAIRGAISEFERATDLDPNYAEAYSGLADSYAVLDIYVESAEGLDYRTNYDRALSAAQRAVSLASENGMAHASLGFGFWLVGDWEESEAALERAIELSPGYAPAHEWYAVLLNSSARAAEGLIHARRAVELDPVSLVALRVLTQSLLLAGETEEGIEQSLQTTVVAPTWWAGWFDRAWTLTWVGEHDEGLEAWLTFARLIGDDVQDAGAAYQAATRYRETGERQTFGEYDSSPGVLLWLYANTGQGTRAMDLFEEMVRAGAYGLASNHDGLYGMREVVGHEPRYQALLAEAGITW